MDLQILWFVIVGFFWAGYFVLEGFDFGVGMLLPILPANNEEREELLETIGPVWDGNEVWLVVAGAATFAAFPAWYASMFSGFYIALLLVLFFLIMRVLSFEWHNKSTKRRWRTFWYGANTAGSIGAPLIWGVGLSNLLYGVPLDGNGDFTGTFWDLFNAYTVFAGVAVVLFFAFHGAIYVTLQGSEDLSGRAFRAARRLGPAAALVAIAFFVWTVVVAVDHNDKSVFPPVVPAALGSAAAVLAVAALALRRTGWGFAMTAAGSALIVATLFTSLYPRVMVSRPNFGNSLSVDNASSAHYTLLVMTVVAVAIVPVVLLYQTWTYHVFKRRVAGAPAA